jgi:hypothetical protein
MEPIFKPDMFKIGDKLILNKWDTRYVIAVADAGVYLCGYPNAIGILDSVKFYRWTDLVNVKRVKA